MSDWVQIWAQCTTDGHLPIYKFHQHGTHFTYVIQTVRLVY